MTKTTISQSRPRKRYSQKCQYCDKVISNFSEKGLWDNMEMHVIFNHPEEDNNDD